MRHAPQLRCRSIDCAGAAYAVGAAATWQLIWRQNLIRSMRRSCDGWRRAAHGMAAMHKFASCAHLLNAGEARIRHDRPSSKRLCTLLFCENVAVALGCLKFAAAGALRSKCQP